MLFCSSFEVKNTHNLVSFFTSKPSCLAIQPLLKVYCKVCETHQAMEDHAEDPFAINGTEACTDQDLPSRREGQTGMQQKHCCTGKRMILRAIPKVTGNKLRGLSGVDFSFDQIGSINEVPANPKCFSTF